MARIRIAVLLGLGLIAGGSFAQPPSIPDALELQAAANRARQAVERDDADEAAEASLALQGMLVRLPDGDSRAQQLIPVMSQLTQVLFRQWPNTEVLAHLEKVDDLAEALDRGRNPAAWVMLEGMIRVKAETGDTAGVRDDLIAAIAREEAYLGPEFPAVRALRMMLVRTYAQLGQRDEAIEMAEAAFDSTAAIYGADSPQAAEILVTLAQLSLEREDPRTAIVLTDRATAIVNQNLRALAPLVDPIGRLYLVTAQFEKAREMFQLMDGMVGSVFPESADRRLGIYRNLAIANARLGDGAAAKRYLTAALDLAQSSLQQSPAQIHETLLLEARIFALAGMFEEATASLTRSETFAAAAGLDSTAAYKTSMASESLFAMELDRSIDFAEAALAMVDETSAIHAAAGNILILASALSDPPVSRLDFANELLDRAERANRNGKHLRERYAVALALAADGRWDESVAMQREIVAREAADAGEAMTNQIQWATFATALGEVGRSEEQARVNARIESQRAPLAAALSNQIGREVLVQQQSGFGFEINLEDVHWQRARPASIGLPMAAFTATYITPEGIGDGSIAVVPLLLPDGINARAAVEAMTDLVYADIDDLEPWSEGELSGYSARSVDPHFSNGLPVVHSSRIIVEPGAVYAVVTSAAESKPDAVAAAEAALDHVQIRRGASVADLSDTELELHGAILNYAGNILFQQDSLNDALDFYRHAADYNDADYVTENLASTQYYLGNYEDAIVTFNAHFARFGETDENLDPQLMRADSYLQIGDIDRALPAFARAFDLGARDDELAGVYVDILLGEGRGSEALDFIDDYMIDNESIDLHALRAMAAYSAGDDGRLGASETVLRDPARSNRDAALILALIVFDRDGETGLDRLITDLAGDDLDSPTLYLILAGSQIEAGRVQGAQATVQAGLERFPNDPDLSDVAANLPSLQEPDA